MQLVDLFRSKTDMVTKAKALPGRDEPLPTASHHFVSGAPLKGPFEAHLETAYFGMGCFWGAERLFWQMPGVYVTAVGYQGGITPNPTYQETCTNMTGHTEIVMVVFDPGKVTFMELLQVFFEEHDPTQGMRQGNDIGTTYRSAIYTVNEQQMSEALSARDLYQAELNERGIKAEITTEIAPANIFYYAEEYHQQYLAKNPGGYCGLKGTGVSCPLPNATTSQP